MAILQTAERSSHLDPSENVIYQRHLIAYKEAAKLIKGTVLEIGSGEGYGMLELAPKAKRYIAIDKYETPIPTDLKQYKHVSFIQLEVPPISEIDDNSIDFVVSFQVIEHIKDDDFFLREIYRVLKPEGKAIITTPNKLMSITRNPWHTREYNPEEMKEILKKKFSNVKLQGIYGNNKVMDYYQKNKEAVRKITRFDIFNLQYWLPGWMLEIPYDILNRFNRQKLQEDNKRVVDTITHKDYLIGDSGDTCLDHFCIATK